MTSFLSSLESTNRLFQICVMHCHRSKTIMLIYQDHKNSWNRPQTAISADISLLFWWFSSILITFDCFLTTAIWHTNARNSIELSYISILTWHSTNSEEDIFLLNFVNFWFWISFVVFLFPHGETAEPVRMFTYHATYTDAVST